MAESEAAGEEGIAILERAPGPHLVEAYGSAAHQLAIAGKSERAMEYVSKGLAVADELEVADIVALVQARATVRGYRSDPRALDDLRESVELGRRLGLGRATAIAMNNLAEGLLIFESVARQPRRLRRRHRVLSLPGAGRRRSVAARRAAPDPLPRRRLGRARARGARGPHVGGRPRRRAARHLRSRRARAAPRSSGRAREGHGARRRAPAPCARER